MCNICFVRVHAVHVRVCRLVACLAVAVAAFTSMRIFRHAGGFSLMSVPGSRCLVLGALFSVPGGQCLAFRAWPSVPGAQWRVAYVRQRRSSHRLLCSARFGGLSKHLSICVTYSSASPILPQQAPMTPFLGRGTHTRPARGTLGAISGTVGQWLQFHA